MQTHLRLSPEFAHQLQKDGILEALYWSLKKFLEKQNYPIYLRDKNIAWLSVFKSLCDFYANYPKTQKPTLEEIIKKTDEIIDKKYPETQETTKEFYEEVIQPTEKDIEKANQELQELDEEKLKKEGVAEEEIPEELL
jgi:uncharacterized membrane protein YgaE (UPF0421/DUF939 family)